ncbi:MFS transporter [Streptomyces sp. NPDC056909]|uniref:MFS transporter n=1 Tax=Streptomyces sp. NPDC056909 TaxID=3345963 RepID=UPI003690A288
MARVLIGAGTTAGYPSAMLLIRRRAEHAGHEAPPLGVLGGPAITGAATVAAALVLAALLVGWELRAAHPFLDVRLLASNGALTRTYARNGLTLMGTYVILYGLTQWLEAARGLSAYQAGLALMPMGVLTAVTARMVSKRTGVRRPLTVCAVLLLVGAVSVLFVGSGTPMAVVVAVSAVFGLTSGTGTVANQTVLYQEAPAATVGTASGLLRTFGCIGSIASAAITGTAFHTSIDDSGLHLIAWVLVVISALVLVMTVFDRQLAKADRRHAN